MAGTVAKGETREQSLRGSVSWREVVLPETLLPGVPLRPVAKADLSPEHRAGAERPRLQASPEQASAGPLGRAEPDHLLSPPGKP